MTSAKPIGSLSAYRDFLIGGLVTYPKPRRRREERNAPRVPVEVVTLRHVARQFLRLNEDDHITQEHWLRFFITGSQYAAQFVTITTAMSGGGAN